MKRLTIFSHHDKYNIIDDYVIYWLEYMSKLSDIIFVSNNNLPNTEIEKIKKFVFKYIIGDHGYFGEVSTIIGYKYAYNNNLLNNYDWIIIILDSIYGPFFDIKPYMENKERKENICYGFTKSEINTENEHIQGTFVALPKKAFISKEITDFLLNFNYKQTKNKNDGVFNYEITFSKILRNLGFKLEGIFDDIDPTYKKYEPMKPSFVEMVKKGYPFVRRTIFTKNYLFIENLKDYLKLKEIIPQECFDNMQKNINRVIPKEDLKINLEYPEIRKNITFKSKIFDEIYRKKYNHSLEFLEVRTFIEKLIWLNLNYHEQYIINFSDKYFVSEYLKSKIDNKRLLPILGVYNNDAEILYNLEIEKLPNNILFTSTINDNKIILKKNNTDNYEYYNYNLLTLIDDSNNKYFNTLEWQYKYIKPRLIVYENKEIYDNNIRYKIMCFNSQPKIIKAIIKDTSNNTYTNFYDLDWNKLELSQEYSNIEHIEKPIYFDEMLNICRKLSQEFPVFASIDFIGNDNEFYFEKFDFYSDELIHPFSNSDLDKELGSYIKIPSTKNEYLAFDNDIYLKTLIKYDEVLLKNISELNSIKLNNDEVYNSKLNEIKNKALELNRKIDELAWWIPIKSLRNKFRKKFKIADQTRPDQTRP